MLGTTEDEIAALDAAKAERDAKEKADQKARDKAEAERQQKLEAERKAAMHFPNKLYNIQQPPL